MSGQDAVRDVTAYLTDIVGRLPFLQHVVHGFLVQFRMRLFHILALAEVEDRRPVPLRLGLFDELAVGDLRHPPLRLETLREILLGRFDLLEDLERPRPVDLLGRGNHPEELRDLRVSLLLRLFRIDLQAQGRLGLTCIGLLQRLPRIPHYP